MFYRIVLCSKIVACDQYYYGPNCNTPCGHCRGDDVCNNETGHCPNGCKPHWMGPECNGKEIHTMQGANYLHKKRLIMYKVVFQIVCISIFFVVTFYSQCVPLITTVTVTSRVVSVEKMMCVTV